LPIRTGSLAGNSRTELAVQTVDRECLRVTVTLPESDGGGAGELSADSCARATQDKARAVEEAWLRSRPTSLDPHQIAVRGADGRLTELGV